MSAFGLRRAVVALCLCGLMAGCHTPGKAQTNSPPDRDPYDGWLWKSVTGQKQAAATVDPNVRPASATEPLPAIPAAITGPVNTADLKPDAKKPSPIESLVPAPLRSTKTAKGQAPIDPAAREAFREGQDLFNRAVAEKNAAEQTKLYAQAADKFAAAAKAAPDTPMEEDALFMLGECQFFSDQYSKAEDTYEQLLKKYVFSRYLERVVAKQFAIGRYWEAVAREKNLWPIVPNFTDKTQPVFDTKGWAMKAYEHVRMNDPNGPLTADSYMATANAHFRDGEYGEAAHYYDLVRKECPDSRHALKASLLTMESKRLTYQGAQYPGDPLVEANEVAEQTLRNFGKTMDPAQRELVVRAKNQFVEELAARQWATAEYYDKRHYYGAARTYYQAIVKDYPNTQLAPKAQQRLEEIKDYPAEPHNYFKWLTEAFDTRRRRG